MNECFCWVGCQLQRVCSSSEASRKRTHIDRCCRLPAEHKCDRSPAVLSWSRKYLNYASPLQSVCSPGCSRTYIEHIHLRETEQAKTASQRTAKPPTSTETHGRADHLSWWVLGALQCWSCLTVWLLSDSSPSGTQNYSSGRVKVQTDGGRKEKKNRCHLTNSIAGDFVLTQTFSSKRRKKLHLKLKIDMSIMS